MKYIKELFYISLCVFIFIFIGCILPHSPLKLQIFLEQLTGYGVLFTLFFVAYKSICIGYQLKNKIMRFIIPMSNICLGVMYLMWLTYNYGQLEPHISAIGFNIPTIAQSISIYILLIALKAERNSNGNDNGIA